MTDTKTVPCEPTAAEYLSLIAQGWEVIETDGGRMTIQNPEDEGPQEYVIDVDAMLAAAPAHQPDRQGAGEAVGCAEQDVGRAVYERIEKLIDAKAGTPEGDELAFLAFIVESVEEVGEYDGPLYAAPPSTEEGGGLREADA